jgi:MerR family transcriptional regulator, light-induced transcriptional regulator
MDQADKRKNLPIAITSANIDKPNKRSEHSLLSLVEAEIIPRLMLAHSDPRRAADGTSAISRNEVIAFTQALLSQDVTTATAIVDEFRHIGTSMEAIYLDLLAASARYLGELWESDERTFTEVTLCSWRIQSMLYDLSPSFQSNAKSQIPNSLERRILIATLPGYQHTLGVSMLSEFFRRESWVVLAIPSPQTNEIQDSLSSNWFDVLALSASTDGEIAALAQTIKAARKTSRNPKLAIMIGGPLLQRQPELVQLLGADGVADDANSAITLATKLVHYQMTVRLN